MVQEAVLTKDPLDTINQSARERAQFRQALLRGSNVYTGNAFGLVGTALLGGAPEVAFTAVEVVTLGYLLYQSTDQLARMMVYKWVNKKQLQSAYGQLQEDGQPKQPETEDDLDQWVRYSLAQQIRTTKLFLAEHGKLDQYQEFNWLQTIKTPEGLKPTQTEVEEVNRYFDQRHQQLTQFVDDLAKRDRVVIQCGDEILSETTQVYLFEDPRNNPNKYRSFSLQEVMRGFAAKERELKREGIRNGIAFWYGSEDYKGIHSSTGRQRITDFFGKPVYFYEGAQYYSGYIERYGVKEPTTSTYNGLPEHLFRLRYHTTEQFAHIMKVEPTQTRLANIGLELARA